MREDIGGEYMSRENSGVENTDEMAETVSFVYFRVALSWRTPEPLNPFCGAGDTPELTSTECRNLLPPH